MPLDLEPVESTLDLEPIKLDLEPVQPKWPAPPEIRAVKPKGAISRGYQAVRETLSPILGPTQEQVARESVPFNGQMVYKPLGAASEQLGLVGALSAKPLAPISHVPQQEGVLAETGAGTLNAVIDLANFMQTPLGAATMGAGTIANIPRLATPATAEAASALAQQQALQRAIAGGFAVDLATKTPEAYQHFKDSDTLQEKVQSGLGLAGQVGFAGLSAKHALTKPASLPAGWRGMSDPTQNMITDKPNIPAQRPVLDIEKPLIEETQRANKPLAIEEDIPRVNIDQEIMRELEARQGTVPETPETVAKQLQLLAEGKRDAVLITPGMEVPNYAEPLEAVRTKKGTFIYDPAKLDPLDIQEAVNSGTEGNILGYGIPTKPRPSDTIGAVTVRTPEGTEVQSVVTDQASLPSVIKAAEKVAEPQDTIAVENPIEVIQKRIQGQKESGVKLPTAPAGEAARIEPLTTVTMSEAKPAEAVAPAPAEPSAIKPSTLPLKESQQVKEPWQMTKGELVKSIDPIKYNESGNTTVEAVNKLRQRFGREVLERAVEIQQQARANLRKNVESRSSAPSVGVSGTPFLDTLPALEKQHRLEAGRATDLAILAKNALAGKSDSISLVHQASIELALKEGKPVPPEVLADYPELAPKSVAEVKPPPIEDVAQVQTAPIERVQLKGSPQTYTVLERPKATELEIANREQPVRIKNERTGEEQTVLEAQIKPVKPSMAGPGSTVPEDVGAAKSDLNQLAESLVTLSDKGTPSAVTGGERMASLKASVADSLKAVKDTFSKGLEHIRKQPQFDNIDRAIGRWSRELQESGRDAYFAWKKINQALPDKRRRNAIGAYVDMGGDLAKLESAAKELPESYARIYRDAQKLTPDEKVLADNIRSYFDSRLEEAQKAGILKDGVENYIRRIYEKDSEWKEAQLSALSVAPPDFAKKRVFETDAEAVKEGYKPIQDFAQRVLTYDQELNKALADRRFVKSLMDNKMEDGRPMIDAGGRGVRLEGEEGGGTLLIKPQFKPSSKEPKNNRTDYKPFNHPAFRRWRWLEKDAEGNDVLVQGDVLVHPEAYERMRRLLEPSRVRAHPVGRALMKFSSGIKQTMLDLSGFHQVQIGVHALEHRIAPSKRFGNLTDIDLKNETQKGLVEHGLMIFDESGFDAFSEGLHSSSLVSRAPGIGPLADAYHNWLFKEYIPTIKMSMALHALERNQKAYPKMSEDAVMKLTAEQANAAFGGLNYKMMGRSKTFQDLLRLAFLAPDFLEARGRFAGQAAKTLVGGFGREQMQALLLGAATLYITSRIVNTAVSGNARMEPENWDKVVIGNHAYGLRTVQGDIMHLLQKPGQFWYHRLNPAIMRPLLEAVQGRDYFGNEVTFGDILINELKTAIPISLRGLVEGHNQTLLESAMNAFGVTSRRFSDVTTAYELAEAWKEKNKIPAAPGEFIYNPKKDPLRNLKVALQYEDSDNVVKEIQKLLKDGTYTRKALMQHFHRYATSPFTGSVKHDRDFMDSLGTEDKKTVFEARKHKQRIYDDFMAALELAAP